MGFEKWQNPTLTLPFKRQGEGTFQTISYRDFREVIQATGKRLPSNGADFKARRLDCAVFNALHDIRKQEGFPDYDTVRGLFWEGAEIYPGASVREANHIQICVRNLDCILGYFRPITLSQD